MISRKLKFIGYLGLSLIAAAAWAQIVSSEANGIAQDSSTTAPSAYIYVASTPANSSTNQIVGYTAAANGSLTPIAGSPFPEDVYALSVNGKYLMAASRPKSDINAYHIEANGALTFAAATDYAQFNNPGGPECGSAGQTFFDHTGSTLYVQEYNGSNACTNTVVASFAVVKATGALTYLGTDITGVKPGVIQAVPFIGNNVYAYTAGNDSCAYWAFFGFKRSSSGMLNSINMTANQPAPAAGVRVYIPNLAAADPTNHVAFTMQPANPPGCIQGPLQMGSYTAASSGNLTTTNTGANMPATKIVSPYDLKMSPSGKLLAVAGQEGLQVFHFNGANPITHYTGLLTTAPINQMFWDNNNHLYAISHSAGKLYVFTITPTTHAMAPGSPHTISAPWNIIVQPLPLF